MEAPSYATMRENFLKTAYPAVYLSMKQDGTLKEHLETIDRQATEMYEELKAQMAVAPTAPQDLEGKASYLASLPQICSEIVSAELVYAL